MCAVDPQRRVLMPRAWRLDGDTAATTFYIMPAPGNVVRVCSTEYFNEQMDLMSRLNPSEPVNQEAMLIVGSLTQAVVPDRQGRFSLSQEILDYGQLGKRVAFVGMVSFGRIVSEELWNECGKNQGALLALEQNIYKERQKNWQPRGS